MRLKRDGGRALLVALTSMLLASCAASNSDTPFGFAMSDIAPEASLAPAQSIASDTSYFAASDEISAFIIEEGDPTLPDAVIAAPMMRPASEDETTELAAVAAPVAQEAQISSVQQQPPANPQAQAIASQTQPTSTGTAAPQVQEQQTQQTTSVEVAALAPQVAAPAKKRSFLSAFFAPSEPVAPQPKAARPLIDPVTASAPVTASVASPAQPLTGLAAAATSKNAKPPVARSPGADANPLPGVRPDSLFEITRRSGIDDDSDIDLHEGDEPTYQLASAAGMARLAPNGLIKQTDNVDVACLKPSLVRVLKTIERHYGRKAVVTSGYRSPDRNRRARGARNSLHMYCAAADIQVEGISKWNLAEYVRTMPGRGGVGTYCHTESVHIDVGPERDWNWRCRRRK